MFNRCLALILALVLCAPFGLLHAELPSPELSHELHRLKTRREIPSMESIYQDLGDKGFVVLGVNEFETPDHVFAYTGQLSVFPNFPILFDLDSKVAELYGVKGLPTTLLINKQGQVVYRAAGGRNFDHPEVRAIMGELLSEGDGGN